MALRQLAVLRNAGSYVIRPKSSADVLSVRRSIARMVPSVSGTSYVLPVRLSVIVRVSAIVVVVAGRVGDLFTRNAVGLAGPSRQILSFASLAAERPPGGIDRMLPAVNAQFYLRRAAQSCHPAMRQSCNCSVFIAAAGFRRRGGGRRGRRP